MNYSISKTKRNNLILSSAFLILNYIILGLSFLLKDVRQLDIVENTIVSILFIIAYTYIFLILIDYFKYYHLKTLQIITLIVLVSDVGNQLFALIDTSFYPIIPKIIFIVFRWIELIGMIIWIILLLRLKGKDYSALQSLKKYAYGFITAFILGLSIAIITMFGGFYDYGDLVIIPIAIPYIFVIEFARKLNIDEAKRGSI